MPTALDIIVPVDIVNLKRWLYLRDDDRNAELKHFIEQAEAKFELEKNERKELARLKEKYDGV